ncbi:hypothetical protein GE09DRAFT_1294258, partial [Coniochaeta sp. 2T2.1]
MMRVVVVMGVVMIVMRVGGVMARGCGVGLLGEGCTLGEACILEEGCIREGVRCIQEQCTPEEVRCIQEQCFPEHTSGWAAVMIPLAKPGARAVQAAQATK